MIRRIREAPEAPNSRWITLGQACKVLGVNESTLRRWADAGHVRIFRTPGGHRRFSEEDLRLLVAGRADVRGEPYGSLAQLALSRIDRRLTRGAAQTSPWYSSLSEDGRERFRTLVSRMVSLASDYLTRDARRGRIADETKELGQEMGRELAESGLGVRVALEAFVFIRANLDDAAIEMAATSDLTASEALEAWDLLSGLADDLLLAFVEAFDKR